MTDTAHISITAGDLTESADIVVSEVTPLPVPSDPTNVYWRIAICTLDGTVLSFLSPVATNLQLKFPLCRPASIAFQVPSFDPHVNILAGDGLPYLSGGNRVIKAWRREAPESEWVLRFAGIVWNLQDSGEANATYTNVTAYDPMQMLTKRIIRSSTGTFHEDVVLALQRGDVIAKAIVDRTITYAGPCGIDTAPGVFTLSPQQSQEWTQQFVATGLIDLCDTGLLDVWFDPVDQVDGILAWMSAGPARGKYSADIDMADFRGPWLTTVSYTTGQIVTHGGVTYIANADNSAEPPPDVDWDVLPENLERPNLSFAAPGHSAFSLDRSVSMDGFANSLYFYPGNVNMPVVTAEDTDSEALYYTYEDVSVLSDIVDPVAVQFLANQQLAMRAQPKDLVTLMPVPGRAFLPWRNYFLGDMINVNVGIGYDNVRPSTREALQGVQRIFGITIDIDENGTERVSGIDFSPQAGVSGG